MRSRIHIVILAGMTLLISTGCPRDKKTNPVPQDLTCKEQKNEKFSTTLANWTDPTSYLEPPIQHFRYSGYYPGVCTSKPIYINVFTELSTLVTKPIQVSAWIEYGDETNLKLKLDLTSQTLGTTRTVTGQFDIDMKDYLPLNDYTNIRVSLDYEFEASDYYYTDLNFFKTYFKELAVTTNYIDY